MSQDTRPEAPDTSSDRYVLGTLETRLVAWLQSQPDVAGVTEVGDGIYGLGLRADGREVPVSLMVNVTP